MTPADALDHLRRAASATDALEHARAFTSAIGAMTERDGEASADDYDVLTAAIEAAAASTQTLLGLAGARLEMGAFGVVHQAYLWSLPQHVRASKTDRLAADMADFAAIFRNDIDTLARLKSLRDREGLVPYPDFIPALSSTPSRADVLH